MRQAYFIFLKKNGDSGHIPNKEKKKVTYGKYKKI